MSENYLEMMQSSSHLGAGNIAYVDELYEKYLKDPNNVSDEWQQFFSELTKVNGQAADVSHADIQNYFLNYAKEKHKFSGSVSCDIPVTAVRKQGHVLQLINAYRQHGHHHASLDPLQLSERKHVPDLDLAYHQLTDADLNETFSVESPLFPNGSLLADIYSALKQTYCSSLGFEYMHISEQTETDWLIERIESVRANPKFEPEHKKQILKYLTEAEGLEKYLGAKYVGQKRFSLEGGDSLIPALRELVKIAGHQGVKEIVIGMAHRGRLNVLVNVLGKSPEELFQEFEGKQESELTGDVKYHMGFSSDIKTKDGVLHLALAFNPSHLEIISPVVQGSVHARQRRRKNLIDKDQVVPVIIHGDAAFAGQGVVMETFNFSQARGYSTGGSIHIVINNQIGFTMSNPLDARSTLYCTDIAKMVQAPIVHVNGDDPEACVYAMQLAFDFRMQFKKDVVIDLVCYRRHGHNEADEPSLTQPWMYATIKQLQTTRQLYAEKLIAEGVINKALPDEILNAYRDQLDRGEHVVETVKGSSHDEFAVHWGPFLSKHWTEKSPTQIPLEKLKRLATKIDTLPNSFAPHSIVKRLWEERKKITAGESPINWGYAELLAYATLIDENFPVRISGQDSCRGTFAHRHAVLHDAKTGEEYVPLKHINKEQPQFLVIDSVLSEEAVLGFEYGYAAAEPNVLTIWEAQFGDFVNGAQVVIDQFISSGEQKWGRLCGLTMLLPHGMEGQGPEHSSARLERFLQLCAQHNMQVCVPSTPAQIYHLLRRQMLRKFRKPLIVMTPKSLLRHKLVVSTWEDLSEGEFQVIIPEIDAIVPDKVRKIILCGGKVYYDLLQKRRENKQDDIAIIRIEQLYPFPQDILQKYLAEYKNVKQIIWCQEEPQNQGAWFSSQHHFQECLCPGQSLSYVGRDFFASPAVGSLGLHTKQQIELVEKALS